MELKALQTPCGQLGIINFGNYILAHLFNIRSFYADEVLIQKLGDLNRLTCKRKHYDGKSSDFKIS